MDHRRDWRAHIDEVSTQEEPFNLGQDDDDKPKHVRVVTPKRSGQEFSDGVKETEVAAQITIAPDGGWGWVVLLCAFLGLGIVDGLVYSYGPMLPDISKDLNISESLGALVNSVLVAMVYLTSPITSALINKFGFRAIAMSGSVVCSLAMFVSYFARHFPTLLICYGIISGFGLSMMSMSVSLVPGFYFEKLRTLALGVVSGGSSIGIMAFYPCNYSLVAMGGWRPTILLHSGISGLVYFLSLSFRPLPSIKVTAEPINKGKEARPVTYLPDMSKKIEDSELAPSITEKTLRTVSNAYYPYAGDLVQAATGSEEQGPSTRRQSRVEMIVTSGVNPDQMKEIRNKMDSMQEEHELKFLKQEKKKGCCGNCCEWEEARDARPMYRDDAFYNPSMKVLEYRKSGVRMSVNEPKKSVDVKDVPRKSILRTRKSAADSPPEVATVLQHQLTVVRVATVKDLEEKKLVCPLAVRRALVSMLDPRLLQKRSFILFCLSGFFINLGLLVPYVYLQARAIAKGLDKQSTSYLVSVLSLANLFGRIVSTLIAMKVSSVNVYGVTMLITGIATMLSGLSYTLVFQMIYSVVFGMSVAASSCLRGVVIVELYGLENLTSGTGLALMFNGLGNAFSTPLAGVLISSLGFDEAFYIAGAFMTVAGLIVIPLKITFWRECKAMEKPNRKSIITIKETPKI